MTLNQICQAVEKKRCVTLPDGRTGTIARYADYDWNEYKVTVTLNAGERIIVSQ